MALRYDIAYALAAVAAAPVLSYRMLRTGKWRTDWASRFGHGPALGNGQSDEQGNAQADAQPGDRPTLMIHGVSVGEINAIRHLVDQLADRPDAPRLVITATTDTGLARAMELFADHHDVVRYPLDFTRCVRRFLDRVRPDAVALAELEVWPNFVRACARRGVPVCVINGRMSDRGFGRYRPFARIVRPTFSQLAAVAAQSATYGERFAALGTPAERIHVLDTMKWDTAEIADDVAGSDALAREMGVDRGRPLIVAGSTAPGEEALIAEAVRAMDGDVQLLLVPRKPERFDEVARLFPGIVRRSEHPAGSTRQPDDAGLFLLDTMGELRKAYALADVAVVGRSFVPDFGGSDPIEPVALGKPTVVGGHHQNFLEVVGALRAGGGIMVSDRVGESVAALLREPDAARELAQRGRSVIRERQGATARHVEMLMRVLGSRTRREA